MFPFYWGNIERGAGEMPIQGTVYSIATAGRPAFGTTIETGTYYNIGVERDGTNRVTVYLNGSGLTQITTTGYEAGVVNSYFDLVIAYGDEYEVLSFNDLIEVKSTVRGDPEVLLNNPEYAITSAMRDRRFNPIELDEISRLYVNHFEIMLEYKEKYGEIIYEYNYEALVKDPSSEIPKIISWLGWEWDDVYLSPHKNKRSVFTASNYQVRQKIYSSSIGVWKEYEELLAPATEIITANQILKDRI